jgi:riboflavin transporter 2
VFIAELPEGNSIASYLIIIIQLGNVIPLAYVVVRQYVRIPYDWVIVGTLGCGIATALLLAFFWDHTALLFGSARR